MAIFSPVTIPVIVAIAAEQIGSGLVQRIEPDGSFERRTAVKLIGPLLASVGAQHVKPIIILSWGSPIPGIALVVLNIHQQGEAHLMHVAAAHRPPPRLPCSR